MLGQRRESLEFTLGLGERLFGQPRGVDAFTQVFDFTDAGVFSEFRLDVPHAPAQEPLAPFRVHLFVTLAAGESARVGGTRGCSARRAPRAVAGCNFAKGL